VPKQPLPVGKERIGFSIIPISGCGEKIWKFVQTKRGAGAKGRQEVCDVAPPGTQPGLRGGEVDRAEVRK